MQQIQPADLSRWLEDGNTPAPQLLDVREDWELARCRIGVPTHIPMAQLGQRLGELDPARPVVVICHHGVRSYHAARFLEQAGFSKVINLSGGVAAWAQTVDRAMPTY